jgi:hypothetical protein
MKDNNLKDLPGYSGRGRNSVNTMTQPGGCCFSEGKDSWIYQVLLFAVAPPFGFHFLL